MAFRIPYNIFQWFIVAADYHVDVTWHDAPDINLKPFFILAILPAFYHFIFVLISCKDIYPIYGGKADEIHSVTIPKFIFTAHGLKLQKYKGRFYRNFDGCCFLVYLLLWAFAILVALNLLALLVVWHKHGQLTIPLLPSLRHMHVPADLEEIAWTKWGLHQYLSFNQR